MADSRLDLIIKARDEASAILKKIQGELGGIDKQSATASRGLDGMRDSLASIGAISSVAFVGIAAGLKTTIDAYSQAQSSQLGFEATAKKLKVPIDNLNIAAQKLSADGLIPLSTAQAGMQNLMQAGLTDVDKITKLMQNFKDEAVFGKSASIDLATAVSNLSESYKTESSSLGNLSGISENYSMVLERGAKQLGKRVVDLTEAERAEAKYLGLLEIGAVSAGNSALASESLAGAQAKANTAFREAQIAIGEALAPALESLLSAVTPIIQKVTEWVEKNPELVAQMAGLALGVTGLGVAMGGLALLMTPMMIAFGKFLVIAAAVTAAAALIKEAYDTNFLGLRDIIDTTQVKFTEFSTVVDKAVKDLAIKVTEYYNEHFKPFFEELGKELGETGTMWTATFGEMGMTLETWWTQIITPLFEQIKVKWNEDFLFLKTITTTVFTAISEFTGNIMLTLKNIVITSWQTMINITKTLLQGMRGDVSGAMNTILETLSSWKSTAIGIIKGSWDFITGIFSDALDGLVTLLKNSGNDMLKTLGDKIADFKQMGADLINGLVEGIKNAASSAVGAAANVARDVSNAVKGFFRIGSPSKLFYDYGGFVVQGLANGITENAGTAIKALDSLTRPIDGSSIGVGVSSERNIGGAVGSSSGKTVIVQVAQMIGDEQYAEKLGDMIVKNLAYSTAF